MEGNMTLIVTDTPCGLPLDLLRQRGIPCVPQVVIFGEQSFHDDGELDTVVFLKMLKASATLPKTAAPEPALYYPIFSFDQDQRHPAFGSNRRAGISRLEHPCYRYNDHLL